MYYRQVAITGGAGFIGSSLAKRLINFGIKVVVIDNLSSGKIENLYSVIEHPNFTFIKEDLCNLSQDFDILKGCDVVFHLAANPDVRTGSSNTQVDFDNNILATYNLLNNIKKNNYCKNIIFTSTSAVYGDATIIPTPETYGPLMPISLYASSKLACESLISAYSHMFGFRSAILRFANVIGPTSNHGVIFDFIQKLKKDSSCLEILGDGNQTKSYLYIDDCLDAILLDYNKLSVNRVNIFNVGSDDKINVFNIANTIFKEMNIQDTVRIRHKYPVNQGRGWIGDVKYMLLDTSKIKSVGWTAQYNSLQAVTKTVGTIFSLETIKEIKLKNLETTYHDL
ncbi:MAG: NAD-dependent epimerase/dehydratase family protein [Nitrososphaeraceae archaeon]